MQREIKFRAWDKETKTMADNIQMSSQFERFIFDPFIPMQFIGLKDRNGKDIYEGDIVEWNDGSAGRWRRRCAVGVDKAHFTLKGYWYNATKPYSKKKNPIEFKFGQFSYEEDGELEVIGNIYEDSNLLKNYL